MSMSQTLPELRHWTLPESPQPPKKRIYTDEDVKRWATTQGYIDYGLFYRRLNEAVVGQDLPPGGIARNNSEVRKCMTPSRLDDPELSSTPGHHQNPSST